MGVTETVHKLHSGLQKKIPDVLSTKTDNFSYAFYQPIKQKNPMKVRWQSNKDAEKLGKQEKEN